jgi:hypothetical protein
MLFTEGKIVNCRQIFPVAVSPLKKWCLKFLVINIGGMNYLIKRLLFIVQQG